jgi:hypothetical protein
VPRCINNVAGGIYVNGARGRQINSFSSSAMKDHRTTVDASGDRLRIRDITFDDFDRETRQRCGTPEVPYECPNMGAALEYQPLDEATTDES